MILSSLFPLGAFLVSSSRTLIVAEAAFSVGPTSTTTASRHCSCFTRQLPWIKQQQQQQQQQQKQQQQCRPSLIPLEMAGRHNHLSSSEEIAFSKDRTKMINITNYTLATPLIKMFYVDGTYDTMSAFEWEARAKAIDDDFYNRGYPDWVYEEFRERDDEGFVTVGRDEDAIDYRDIGMWGWRDLYDKLDVELDPYGLGDRDPNDLDPLYEYLPHPPLDEEGVHEGWNPIFGEANPFDYRTRVTGDESFWVDEHTRVDELVPPSFHDGDLEIDFNKKVMALRKSLKIVYHHTDPWANIEVPTHVQRWHGYKEQPFEKKNFTNNRFTKEGDFSPFHEWDAHRCRKHAVFLARSRNNEWLPEGKSAEHHYKQRTNFRRRGLRVGTFEPGPIDEEIRERIQPALKVLGDSVELLEIIPDPGVFRFKYHGLIKHKWGFSFYARSLIEDCDVNCTNVVLETGFRERDRFYDTQHGWYGPIGMDQPFELESE